MKESDLKNISEINMIDTLDIRPRNSEYKINKFKIDSSLFSCNLNNTEDELSKVTH